MKTLVVVLGPTGVGKTELCIKAARHVNSPIINADSRQIYAEIPVGTAAPTQGQQRASSLSDDAPLGSLNEIDDVLDFGCYFKVFLDFLDTFFQYAFRVE